VYWRQNDRTNATSRVGLADSLDAAVRYDLCVQQMPSQDLNARPSSMIFRREWPSSRLNLNNTRILVLLIYG
jgi:hypothetical protein